MSENSSLYVVKSVSDLTFQTKAFKIAGSKHVLNEMLKSGSSPINPDELLGNGGKRQIAARMADISRALQAYFETTELSIMVSEALSSVALKSGFRLLALDLVGKQLGLPDSSVNIAAPRNAKLLETDKNLQSALIHSMGFLLDNFVLFNDHYRLDFSSQSGKKFHDPNGPRLIRPFSADVRFGGLNLQFHNKIEYFKRLKTGERIRYKLPRVRDSSPYLLDLTRLEKVLGKIIQASLVIEIIQDMKKAYLEFCQAKATMNDFLKNCVKSPQSATFNNFGSMELCGFGDALSEAGIPTEMNSHGAMVAHGSSDRKAVMSILSRAIYNEPACAFTLIPRSPLQISHVAYRNKIRPKLRIEKEKTEVGRPRDIGQPMKIYLAPNFLSWFDNLHGISQSCFEADACIRAIASAVSMSNEVELFLRIKTTTKDVSRRSIKQPIRGLLPTDFTDLINPLDGIFDASIGSHLSFMRDADLVVTEGATAVMFEALEMRKPVLFVNQDGDRQPSLPATRIKNAGHSERSATYCCSLNDDLVGIFHAIDKLHSGKPLRDDELNELIWV